MLQVTSARPCPLAIASSGRGRDYWSGMLGVQGMLVCPAACLTRKPAPQARQCQKAVPRGALGLGGWTGEEVQHHVIQPGFCSFSTWSAVPWGW